MASEDEKIVSTDQLPDEPLKMPPPYWRSPGASLQILDALQTLVELFHKLIPVLEKADEEFDKHLLKYPEYSEDEEQMDAFGEIMEPLWDLESKVKMKADLVSLMSAIAVEDRVNMFCVYNLHKDIAESIEQLSTPDKFLVACAAVGKEGTKGNAVFESIKKLTQWRNAYAHGHCVDRPTKSLRHNHLISPKSYPNVWTSFNVLLDHCQAYLDIDEYLRECSLNPYTKGDKSENYEISEFMIELLQFTFIMSDDTGVIYSLRYDGDDELIELGKLPPGSPTMDEMVNEDRGEV